MNTSTISLDAQSLILHSIADHIKQRQKENPHLISCACVNTIPKSIEARYRIYKERWRLPLTQQAIAYYPRDHADAFETKSTANEPHQPNVIITHVITLQSDRLMIISKYFVDTEKYFVGRSRKAELDISMPDLIDQIVKIISDTAYSE